MYLDTKITLVFCKLNKNIWNNILEILLATFRNIIQVFKIGPFQGNLSAIFLKVLNIYSFSKIFQRVEIVMLRWNIF